MASSGPEPEPGPEPGPKPGSEYLSVALLNIRGLRDNMNHLQDMIANHKVHVVALCETKLDQSIKDSKVFIPGFRMWRRDRESDELNPGGGVALYVQDHIKTRLRLDLMEPKDKLKKNKVEIIWVEMELPDKPVLVGSCYRHPEALVESIDVISKMMTQVMREQKDVILMGDFNFDWLSEKSKKRRITFVSEHGLTQMVSYPTRKDERQDKVTERCIDHIYTNITRHGSEIAPIDIHYSDHRLVTIKLDKIIPKKGYRSDNQLSQEFAKKEKYSVNWDIVYNEPNPKNALSKFTDKYLLMTGEHALLQNDVWDSLRLDGKFPMPAKNSKKKYLALKKLHEIKEKENRQDFMKPLQNPETCPQTIQKRFKKYFGESLPSHVINIRQSKDVTSDLYYLQLKDFSDDFSFNSSKIEVETVNKYLDSCLGSITDDIHDINAELLKFSATCISGPIRHILNLCIEKSVFPSELKQFELIPFSTNTITKPRQDSSPDSLHVMIGYVFDIILCRQVQQYFIIKKLIPSESLNDEIKKLKKAWETAIEKQQTVRAVFLDFSSSFDTISHDLLIDKLEVSGFSPEALSLITSFLSYDEGSHGLPRGSFLAQLLFTFFINDLKSELKSSTAVICQNHMLVYAAHEDHKKLKKQIKADIKKVCGWAKSHTLTYRINGHLLKYQEAVSPIFELLNSLLDCNQFNLNWIQVLKKTMKYQVTSWKEICDKTIEKHKKCIGKKLSKAVSKTDLLSLVLL